MEKAIIYKEWLKTRLTFIVALAIAIALAVYAVIMMNRLIQLKGVDHLWLIMLLKDNTFIDIIKYLPIAAGVAVGAAQMMPEMAQSRLKLTLHLPYPMHRLVGIMILTGMLELLVIFGLQLGIIAVYDLTILHPQLVGRVVLTTLPWYFAGFTAYLFTTAVCLEGTNRRRIILALIGVAVLIIYFLQPAMEAYNGMIIIMILAMAAFAVLPFGSVTRFKEGRRD